MPAFLSRLFDTSDFPARWHCGNWTAAHGWTHIASDVAIFAAYAAIPAVLAYFVLRRKDVPFQNVFWLFVAFIFSCGFGHLLEATIFWHPWYRVAAVVKVITAVVSWATVLALIPILPRALALPGLAVVNRRLKEEIDERKRAEEAARRAESLKTAILESALDAIITMDHEGKVVEFNPAAERTFGYSRAELIGKCMADFIIPASLRDAHTRGLANYLATGQGPVLGKRLELKALRADGSEFPCELTVTRIDFPGPPLFTGYIRDLTERKTSDETFRLVVESAPNAMVLVDREGRIVLVNRQTEKLFGYSRDELLGQPVESLVPERFRGQHPAHRSEFFAKPEARAMGVGRDLFGRRKDGSEFPIEIGLNPIQTHEGLFVLSAIVDITERQRAEKRFRLAVESAPNAMVMVDRGGRIVLVNGQTQRLFGYSRDELLGQSVELLVPERFRGQHPHDREGYFARPAVRAMGVGRDLHGRRKDGSEFPVEIGLNPIETEEGLLVLSAIVDITERKRANEALRTSEEMFRSAFDRTNVGMVLTEVDSHRFIQANAAFARMFGYAESEIPSLSMPDITHPEDLAESLARRQPLLAGERDFFEIEKRYLHKDGSVIWGLTNVSLVRDRTGQPLMYVGQVQDISERKRAVNEVHRLNAELEERVRMRTAELEAANRELESFSYSVSHDLRAPLRAIDGFSRILLQEFAEALPADAQEYLRDVRASTQQMGELVDDLLAFSRLSRQPLEQQVVSPERIVRRCLEEMDGEHEGRQVEVRVGELSSCLADPALLKQVWMNLLSNALKYTGRRPTAVIEVGSQIADGSGRPTYFVKDNGVGFDMRYADKLFGVFQRLHRAEDYGGTGVGLAIVQRIVHRHGGRVWAEAQPDQGATFYFTLGDGGSIHG